MLSRQGIPSDRLKDVFTPIGLPIGAESPEEIALSITAELVCVRRKTGVQAKKTAKCNRHIGEKIMNDGEIFNQLLRPSAKRYRLMPCNHCPDRRIHPKGGWRQNAHLS